MLNLLWSPRNQHKIQLTSKWKILLVKSSKKFRNPWKNLSLWVSSISIWSKSPIPKINKSMMSIWDRCSVKVSYLKIWPWFNWHPISVSVPALSPKKTKNITWSSLSTSAQPSSWTSLFVSPPLTRKEKPHLAGKSPIRWGKSGTIRIKVILCFK